MATRLFAQQHLMLNRNCERKLNKFDQILHYLFQHALCTGTSGVHRSAIRYTVHVLYVLMYINFKLFNCTAEKPFAKIPESRQRQVLSNVAPLISGLRLLGKAWKKYFGHLSGIKGIQFMAP